MSAIRLVAIDLDGTLIGSDLLVSDTDRDAIHRAEAAGVSVCFATGRLFSAGRRFADELGTGGYLIPLNGAAVYDLPSSRMVKAVPLVVDVAREALDALRENGFRVQLYFDDRLYLDGTDERTDEYLRLSRIEPVLVPDLRELLNGKRPSEPGPMKVLGISSETHVLQQVRELGDRFGSRANVFRSLRQYLEITDPGANKGAALSWLAGQQGLDSASVAAIGDSDNDASMLQWAGRSFAVANGTPLAKATAQRVVAPQGLGVAEALNALLAESAYERT